MNNSRLTFWLLIAAALIAITVSAALRVLQPGPERLQAVAMPVTILPRVETQQPAAVATAPIIATATAANAPEVKASTGRFSPIWGPNYKENDGRERLVCAAYAFSADYPLQQIQMSGLDIKHGFHLGIVPFYLNGDYVVTEKNRMAAVQSGQIDCLLTTFDSIALDDPGIITTFINESAGGDQIWARDLGSLNDLKGKRITFEAHGPSEFFVLDLLNTVRIAPGDVQFVPQPDQASAIAAFNRGEADVVAGWEPVIRGAEKGGGKLFTSSRDFRSILGAIVMSRQAMRNKRPVIQLFHNAWFEALEVQQSDFARAARHIADWGHNEYTGVSVERADEDLRKMLAGVAQADLADNARAFESMPQIVERLRQTRNLWASAGYAIPTSDIGAVIDPTFVQNSARGKPIAPNGVNRFVNNSFALGRFSAAGIPQIGATVAPTASVPVTTALQAVTPKPATGTGNTDTRTVATLPCSRFDFLPNSIELTDSAKQLLIECALPILRQSPTLYLRIKGSSAWPGPKGAVQQIDVESTARKRAEAIADFLVELGVKKERLFITWTLPPEDHWETLDLLKQVEDRYVELSLLVSGL